MSELEGQLWVPRREEAKVFRCSKGHEWTEEQSWGNQTQYRLAFCDWAGFPSNTPWCVRCLAEFFAQHIGVAEEVPQPIVVDKSQG